MRLALLLALCVLVCALAPHTCVGAAPTDAQTPATAKEGSAEGDCVAEPAAKPQPKPSTTAVSLSAEGADEAAQQEAQGAVPVPAFVATEEWQEVLAGQQVPPELDVRVELASGKEFARRKPAPPQTGGMVLEEAEGADATPLPETAAKRAARVATMYNVLLGLPQPPPELEAAKTARLSPEELEALLKTLWERRQTYLREAMSDIKTEGELLQGNLAMLGLLDSSKPEEQARLLELLEELEYLVANTDNAHTLNKINGWPKVVERLNDTDVEVSLRAAWVVGTAVKLDAHMQGEALDIGLMPVLVGELARITSNIKHSTKFVYAIGQLLRDNRRAQRIFTGLGGFAKMRDAVQATLGLPDGPSEGAAKLHARVAALVSDLLDDGNLPQLQAELRTREWCALLADVSASTAAASLPLHELLLNALVKMAADTTCRALFEGEARVAAWRSLSAGWASLPAEEEGEEGSESSFAAALAKRLAKFTDDVSPR